MSETMYRQTDGDMKNDDVDTSELQKIEEPDLLEDGEMRDPSPTSESMPHYYPQDHEVTRWLINQIRCRNGLHYLVNVVNSKPDILSSHFEIADQPNTFSDNKAWHEAPAYHQKATLYLTPLCIAIYLKLKSVVRLLLDSSGDRINLKSRRHVDINAVCYVKRNKPKPGGQAFFDEYCTTHASVLAVRREFFTGLSLLMLSGFHPQAPFIIAEHLGTPRQINIHHSDILEYAVRMLSTRPGLDIMNLLHTISYRIATSLNRNTCLPFYDLNVYEVYAKNFPVNNGSRQLAGDDLRDKTEVWCSLFRRIVRRGAAKGFSNCGSRLLSILEEIVVCGFFRQPTMVRGQRSRLRNNCKLTNLIGRKLSPEDIANLSDMEKTAACVGIGLDRDSCIAYLLAWISRVRNRCLFKQRQRLIRLLTTILHETELLTNFINPPRDVDTSKILWPIWLGQIDNDYIPIGFAPSTNSDVRNDSTQGEEYPLSMADEHGADTASISKLPMELPQLNLLREEVAHFAVGLQFLNQPKYNANSKVNDANRTRQTTRGKSCDQQDERIYENLVTTPQHQQARGEGHDSIEQKKLYEKIMDEQMPRGHEIYSNNDDVVGRNSYESGVGGRMNRQNFVNIDQDGIDNQNRQTPAIHQASANHQISANHQNSANQQTSAHPQPNNKQPYSVHQGATNVTQTKVYSSSQDRVVYQLPPHQDFTEAGRKSLHNRQMRSSNESRDVSLLSRSNNQSSGPSKNLAPVCPQRQLISGDQDELVGATCVPRNCSDQNGHASYPVANGTSGMIMNSYSGPDFTANNPATQVIHNVPARVARTQGRHHQYGGTNSSSVQNTGVRNSTSCSSRVVGGNTRRASSTTRKVASNVTDTDLSGDTARAITSPNRIPAQHQQNQVNYHNRFSGRSSLSVPQQRYQTLTTPRFTKVYSTGSGYFNGASPLKDYQN